MFANFKINGLRNRRCLPIYIAAAVLLAVSQTDQAYADGKHSHGAAKPPAIVATELALRQQVLKGGPPERADARLLRHALDAQNASLEPVLREADHNSVATALDRLRRLHRRQPRQRFLEVFPQETLKESAEHLDETARATAKQGFPFKDYPPHPLVFPLSWDADPYRDRGWRFQLNAWHFLDPHLLLYERKGDPAYLAFPVRVAVDWSRQHIAEQRIHEFTWYDMAAGRRAAMLAKILDAALGDPAAGISDEDVLRLLVAARVHVKYLSDASQIAWHSNHGLAQLAGLLALSRAVPELNGVTAAQEFARANLKKLFREHFTAEGIHKEHSPVYHVELVNFLWHLLDTELLTDADMQRLFASASANVISYVHPNGNLSRIGDGDTNLAAERILFPPSPQLDFVLSNGTRGVIPESAFQLYRASGYAVFRSDWTISPPRESSYLFFTASFHSRTHKQADDFTFEWADQGQELVIDSGKFRYDDKDPRRQYAVSSRAHNTVEIDGRNYSRYRLDAFGSAITSGGSAGTAYFVEAEVDRKRFFQTVHQRILVFQPGHWLAVIDQLQSPEPHTYTQWFHFAPELTVAKDGPGCSAPLPGGDTMLHVIPLQRRAASQLSLIKGQHQPRLQGWTSLNYGELSPNYAAGFTTHGRNGMFVTLLWLGDPQSKLRPGNTLFDKQTATHHVRWQVNGREHGFDYRRLKTGGKLKLLDAVPVADKPRSTTVR